MNIKNSLKKSNEKTGKRRNNSPIRWKDTLKHAWRDVEHHLPIEKWKLRRQWGITTHWLEKPKKYNNIKCCPETEKLYISCITDGKIK